jgi:hypothetical protein
LSARGLLPARSTPTEEDDMNLHAVSDKGYESDVTNEALEDFYSDMRFKLDTLWRIEGYVNAALLMIERGALTPAKARAALTKRERIIFDRALELATS